MPRQGGAPAAPRRGGTIVVVSIGVFESEAAAEESNEVAAGWVPDALAEFELTVPEITQGEVLVSVSP
jgi:hypothetical protein